MAPINLTILAICFGLCSTFVIKDTVEPRMCNLATDCHDNECCVSNVRPIGKRQTSFHGHCIPLGKVGDGCLVRNGNATSRPTELVFACPCTPGLYCHGDHHYDIPLGEIGHCANP
uniref:Prokineticin domain-containing protein n=1 Tax=Magallana gigas TaxID=29159 RepID=A0A8W8K8W0_MAGGI